MTDPQAGECSGDRGMLSYATGPIRQAARMMECLSFQLSFLIEGTSWSHFENIFIQEGDLEFETVELSGLTISPNREPDMKGISNDTEHRTLTDKHMQAMSSSEIDHVWSCMREHKQMYKYLPVSRYRASAILALVFDFAFWKGIMLMLWPLDVDVFASLNGLFLFFSVHFTQARNHFN